MKTYFSFLAKNLRYRLKRCVWSIIAPYCGGVLINTDFGVLIVDPRDNHVSRQLIKWGSYNPEEVKLYRNLSTTGENALFVGVHIGALAFQLCNSFERITCIEANPTTFQLLEANIALRGLSSKMQAFNLATSNSDGIIQFLCNRDNTGGSKRVPKKRDRAFYYDSPSSESVEAVRLDSLFPDVTFDFILMDIEGSEYDSIVGGLDLIRRCNVFIVEFVPDHVKGVANRSVNEFGELLLSLKFDWVEFPRAGIKDRPETCLLETLCRIDRANGYEDGLIFTRGI